MIRSLPSMAVLSLLAISTAPAQDMATRGREIFKKNQNTVITVQLVVKSKFGFGGGGGDARESKQEVTGTVIDPAGLTAASLSSTDPTRLLPRFIGGICGDDHVN